MAEARIGVDRDRNVAIFALDGQLKPADRTARLWAQTERLKAAALAAHLTGDEARWRTAAPRPASGWKASSACPGRGLWRDPHAGGRRLRGGSRALASSFYHIVCAIAELSAAGGRDRSGAERPLRQPPAMAP